MKCYVLEAVCETIYLSQDSIKSVKVQINEQKAREKSKTVNSHSDISAPTTQKVAR